MNDADYKRWIAFFKEREFFNEVWVVVCINFFKTFNVNSGGASGGPSPSSGRRRRGFGKGRRGRGFEAG